MELIEFVGKENEKDVKATLDTESHILTISGSGAMKDGKVFPDYTKEIESVIIGRGVSRIGAMAFCGMTSLSSANIDMFVEEIGDSAFFSTALTEVVIPDALRKIGRFVFADCKKLEKITINAQNVDYGFSVLGSNQKRLASKQLDPEIIGDDAYINKLIHIRDDGIYYGYGIRNQDGSRKASIKYCSAINEHETTEGLLGRLYGSANDDPWVYEEFVTADIYKEITIKKLPSKMKYAIGDALDLSGMEVAAAFKHRPGAEVLTEGFAASGFDSSSLGEKVITITYTYSTGNFSKDYTTTLTVKVTDNVRVTWLGFYGEILLEEVIATGTSGSPPELSYGSDFDAQYDFIGWDSNYTSIYDDCYIRAKYELKTFTVTFADYDGTVLKTETVGYGYGATAPESPSRDGYIFSGWDKDYSYITEDMAVKATYYKYVAVESIFVDNTISIKKGQEKALNASVVPSDATVQDVIYESSDEDIAQVDENGIVTAVASGDTKISVKSKDNEKIASYTNVNVIGNTDLNGLNIVPEEIYIGVGEKEQLSVFVDAGEDADARVIFSSSSTCVTIDNNGIITGKKEGEGYVKAYFSKKPSLYSLCKVYVENSTELLDDLYENDSIKKETFIHSKSGKFKDITNSDIVAESMEIKEAISTSAPLMLGGCISNSFKIRVNSKQFYAKEPNGDIEVYQKVKGRKVVLFTGTIYSAERQGDILTREIIAYDKMYKAYNTPIASLIKKQSFPTRIGKLKKLVLNQIGLTEKLSGQAQKYGSIKSLDSEPIYSYCSYYYKTETVNGKKVKNKKKRIYYDIPGDLTAGDFLRDYCEALGCFGWVNRNGVLEYISWDGIGWDNIDWFPDMKKEIKPFSGKLKTGDTYYKLNSTLITLESTGESKKYGKGSQTYEISEDNVLCSMSLRNGYRTDGKINNQFDTYPMKYGINYLHGGMEGLIWRALGDRVIMPICVTQKFRPSIKVGDFLVGNNKKTLQDGTTIKWTTKSAVLERTIKGTQFMIDTIEAKVGSYSSKSAKGKVVKYKVSGIGSKVKSLNDKVF